MERINRKKNLRPKYQLSEVRVDVKDDRDSQELFCPYCNFVLANVVHGVKGFNSYRHSKLLEGEYLGGNIPIFANGALGSGQVPWQFCIQLPRGFVSKGKIKDDTYRGMKQFMYDESFLFKPTRTTSQHIKREISSAESSHMSERSVLVRRLIDGNPDQYDRIAGWARNSISIEQITEEATRLGLSLGPVPAIEAREKRIERAKKKAYSRLPDIRTSILQPELPVAIFCPKCSELEGRQIIMAGAIILITSLS